MVKAIAVQINRLFRLRPVKFLFSGGIAASVEYVFFVLLIAFHMGVFVAAIASFAAGAATSYLLNSRFVFDVVQSRDKKTTSIQVTAFLILVIISSVLSSSLVVLMSQVVIPQIAKPIVMAVMAVCNYNAMKHLVFRDHA